MILLCGIPTEPPLALVREALDRRQARYLIFTQRHIGQAQIHFEIAPDGISGQLRIGAEAVDLASIRGVYTRLMDDAALPEIRSLPQYSPVRLHSRRLHTTLLEWMEVTPARVVNRCAPMATNSSKPYQMQSIREHGFRVPDTLITNDPECVQRFQANRPRLIYKSASSVRSIVHTLDPEDSARLQRIRWCPTQFQEFVEGVNVRVHVVGDRVFATRIETDAIDYRYASRDGKEAKLSPVDLDEDVSHRCAVLANFLGLPFAGLDLKITPHDEVFCFEVNPSPGFSYFQQETGEPIADAVAEYLTG